MAGKAGTSYAEKAAYVAANMVQEALAEKGKAEGRPTLAVSFGPIGDAGYLTRTPEVAAMIAARMLSMSFPVDKSITVSAP